MRLMLLVLLLVVSPAHAYYPWEMWQGDQAMKKGQHQQAEAHYRAALKEDADSSAALYNLGVSLYRQEKLDEAAGLFKRVADAKDTEFSGRAAYNLGNTLFRQNKLKEALEAYKTALRWNELDDDARHNIEVILEKLKQQQQQQDNQKQKQDQEKKKQDEDKKKDDQQKQDQDQKQNENEDENKEKQQQQQDQEQGQDQQEGGMNRQDAERLLQYFEDKEKEAGKRVRAYKARPPRGNETW